LGEIRLEESILLELLVVPREILPLEREVGRVEMEGREALFELLRELCLLPELLDDDLEDDCLRPCLDAETGSAKIIATRAIMSTIFCIIPDFFIITS
jgi:hypothetical protein